jgi:hypothetical protein
MTNPEPRASLSKNQPAWFFDDATVASVHPESIGAAWVER